MMLIAIILALVGIGAAYALGHRTGYTRGFQRAEQIAIGAYTNARRRQRSLMEL